MARAYTDDEFFAPGMGPGTFMWSTVLVDGEEHQALYLKVPRVNAPFRPAKQDYEILCLYVMRDPALWNKPGHVKGWDGNWDKPTLTPSILVKYADGINGWHGYVEKGQLRDD